LLKVRVLEKGWRKKGEIQSEVPLEIVIQNINENLTISFTACKKQLRAGKRNFPFLA